MQRTASLFISKNVLVNPFMTYKYAHVLFHPIVNLLSRPFHLNQSFNEYPSASVNTRTNVISASVKRKIICLLGSVASSTAISLKLMADGRFVHSDDFGNLSLCMTYFNQRIYSVSLFQRELAVWLHLRSSFLTAGKVRSLTQLCFFYNTSSSCT